MKNMETAEKASHWLWFRRGWVRGVVCYLDTSRGLIAPSWVTRVRVSDVRPETSLKMCPDCTIRCIAVLAADRRAVINLKKVVVCSRKA